jgi:cellulose biosynthesis protein BcsQ
VTTPNRRDQARRLTIFNHKGGVGKTTLTMNVAYALAALGRRVLLVDSDPQCNLTSYLIEEEVVDDLLDKSDTAAGRTAWSAVKPISEGSGSLKHVQPIEIANGLYLLPGDIRLSEFEADLTEFWALCLQRKIRGFRGTTALSELVTGIVNDLGLDYVFYDCGPNIGPLNRALILDCDALVVPVACDLFSLRALKTLGRTLIEWLRAWDTISELAPEQIYLLRGRPTFLGYIPEGFRVYAGQVTQQHSAYLSRIEKEVYSQLIALLRDVDSRLAPGHLKDFKLGEVKHLGALAPASQAEGKPVYGVSGGSPAQRQEAKELFMALAERIDARLRGLAE